MKFWIILCFLFSPALFAQDAKVIQLTPEDAKEAKAAYEEMKSAEKKWADIQAKMQHTYKGFDYGLEFSSDFKFIVPKQSGYTTANVWPPSCCCAAVPAITWGSTSTCGNCSITTGTSTITIQ